MSPVPVPRCPPNDPLTPDLREHYNPADERYDERYAPLPAPAASPPDTSVLIPSSLAALAAPAPDAPYLAPLPPMDEFPGAGDTVALDRGEMGGKRRKAPHERAGWKEILEEEERAKIEAAGQATTHVAAQHAEAHAHAHTHTHAHAEQQAQAQQQQPQQQQQHQQQQGEDAKEEEYGSKMKRAKLR